MSNMDYWPPQAVPAHAVTQIKKEGAAYTLQPPLSSLVQDNDHQWVYPTELQVFKI